MAHTQSAYSCVCVCEREIARAKKRLKERKTERERKKESVIEGHTQKESGFVYLSSATHSKEYT